MNPKEVHTLLRERKSVYPPQFLEKEISKETIEEILESANWAPSHRLTEPWRFKVFRGESRKSLGNFMAEKYRSLTPATDFSVSKYEKMKMNPVKSGARIAI